MAGNLTFDQLKKRVAAGDIDTVLAAAVDMQGRLIGKRFLASFVSTIAAFISPIAPSMRPASFSGASLASPETVGSSTLIDTRSA